ncbi:MAG TPA: hypothetical protein VN222_09740 [Novosphingobium sp.]|nr:hypothetical protein [Novosphingobium sp.]
MALRVDQITLIVGGTSLFASFMLLLDRVIAGVTQCRVLGCLPW